MMAAQADGFGSGVAGSSGQYSTFFVADLFFGVDVLRVQEVLRYQQMTRIPQAPAVVAGLINLRGQIVIAIDMRRRLGLPPRPGDQSPMNIVVRTDDGAVSLLVDEIGDVLMWTRPLMNSRRRTSTPPHARSSGGFTS
jgi:purine-binding chemotaxis protein CheW